MLGKISAIGAVAIGVLFGVNAYFLFATGVSGGLYVGVALALILGGVRTLGKMSGGLRLLAGAWGFAAGLMAVPISVRSGDAAFDVGGLVIALIALLGLALAILHKESKA